MRTPAADLVGIDFPLFAFSHCRDVVAAVTNAGGFGVLGATTFTPDELHVELSWIDDHTGGRPYGVDVLIPSKVVDPAAVDARDYGELIPQEHRGFVADLLRSHDLEAADLLVPSERLGVVSGRAAKLLDVAFDHPIRLIANALGVPTPEMIDHAHGAGVPVAALVGTGQHAERQVGAGVDLIVAQGSEAGGHTGEVATMVLVPEVVDLVAATGSRAPVLAAGGIVSGRQMAAAMALGADGVWTGSVWLTTEEAETAPATKAKMLEASSSDTVRSRSRTGKPSRQLRSEWTDAWEAEESPAPLPMPLQTMLAEPALRRVDQAAASGHEGARRLATYWVGQGVGMLHAVRPVRQVMAELMEEFADTAGRLEQLLD